MSFGDESIGRSCGAHIYESWEHSKKQENYGIKVVCGEVNEKESHSQLMHHVKTKNGVLTVYLRTQL